MRDSLGLAVWQHTSGAARCCARCRCRRRFVPPVLLFSSSWHDSGPLAPINRAEAVRTWYGRYGAKQQPGKPRWKCSSPAAISGSRSCFQRQLSSRLPSKRAQRDAAVQPLKLFKSINMVPGMAMCYLRLIGRDAGTRAWQYGWLNCTDSPKVDRQGKGQPTKHVSKHQAGEDPTGALSIVKKGSRTIGCRCALIALLLRLRWCYRGMAGVAAAQHTVQLVKKHTGCAAELGSLGGQCVTTGENRSRAELIERQRFGASVQACGLQLCRSWRVEASCRRSRAAGMSHPQTRKRWQAGVGEGA